MKPSSINQTVVVDKMDGVTAHVRISGPADSILGSLVEAPRGNGREVALSFKVKYPGKRTPDHYTMLPISGGVATEAWRALEQLWNQAVITGAEYDEIERAIKLAERFTR